MDRSPDLKQQVEQLRWVHTIDLGNGIVTRGLWRPSPLLLSAFSDIDFRGKKVLDVGCWDGLWSFEAERRGASEVYATDYVSQRWGREQPTFLLAKRALNSRALYFPDISVYDLPQRLGVRGFDVVLFCGVYYHLKDPVLAFTRLRQMVCSGGLIVVEGDAIDDGQQSYARFFYSEWHNRDPSNWWLPTVRCLREWIESAFFEPVQEYRLPQDRRLGAKLRCVLGSIRGQSQHKNVIRYALTARAVCRQDSNYCYPDPELCEFDLNQYK